MRICHLAASHTTFSGRMFQREALSARAADFEVTIIGAADGFPADPADHGCRVIPLPKTSRAGKLLAAVRLFRLGRREQCDVYHCHDLASLAAGAALKLLRRGRLIYDAHEDYPRTHAANIAPPGTIRKMLHGVLATYEWPLARMSDAVLTVDPLICRKFLRMGAKACTLPNFPRLQPIHQTQEKSPDWRGRRVLIYSGGLTRQVAILETIAAIPQVRESYPEILLVFIGAFSDTELRRRAKELVNSMDLTGHVAFLDEVPMTSMREIYPECYAGLMLYASGNTYGDRLLFPVKLTEYMAAGLPIVASSFRGLAGILRTYNCGLVVNPDSPSAIAFGMMQLLNNPDHAHQLGRAARKAFERRFHWEAVESRLFAAYGCPGRSASLDFKETTLSRVQ